MNLSKQRALVLPSGLILLLALSVAAQDYTVVAGERVGSVRLGATRSETTRTLGKPNATMRRRSGLIKDSWLEPEKPNSEDPQEISLQVIYQANRVVQIELSDPKYATAEGISVNSTLGEFRAKYKSTRIKAYGYDDGEGSGYVGYYFDDVRRGIAFTFRTQDLFDARTVPESLCIHAGGRPVIPDPGGKPHRPTDERPVPKDASETVNQHVKNARPEKTPQEIEAVIRQFWEGLGRLDSDKMKQSMDWPVTIIEGSMTNSKQAIVLRNPLEFDEEFKRTPASAIEKGRSEFFGTKLLAFKVEMLSPNLASVKYSYRLPRDLVARDPKSKGGVFNAVTVLRRDPREGNRWKIVFITVPA